MSSPNPPKPPKLPPLVDPEKVQERYADDVVGVQYRGNGTWHFTFSISRPNHTMAGATQDDPDMSRVVVNRLVLTDSGVSALLQSIDQVQARKDLPPAKSN
jgi:hypothetical protein